MVSSLASLVSTGFLSRFLPRPMRPVAASVSRYFGSSTVSQHDYDRGDRSLEVNHRSSHTMHHHDNLFSEAFCLFYPTRSLSEVLNPIDQFTNNPFLSASCGVGAGIHLGWDAKESDDALHLRVDMPGLDKEDVKVSVVQNTLTIKRLR
ncbi:hypothetical protein L6164_023360 [Bauhinia variegata]|uniref:Uncharacterized protein n=1 Tax=Bauhinia variegata TaxID=167791 RepID=A0ACB9MIB5_BAUVA|nr:hypothetical protein L6164_023360 [Bauhinia variegata]